MDGRSVECSLLLCDQFLLWYSCLRLGSLEADAEFGVHSAYYKHLWKEGRKPGSSRDRNQTILSIIVVVGSIKPLPNLPSSPTFQCKNCVLECPCWTGMAIALYSCPYYPGHRFWQPWRGKELSKWRLCFDNSWAAQSFLEGGSEWYMSVSSTTSKSYWV